MTDAQQSSPPSPLEMSEQGKFSSPLIANSFSRSLTFIFSLQRYLKPKFARQKNKKEATYKIAKRVRVQLVEQFLRDPFIQPF